MLIIERKVGQVIVIRDDIQIKVVSAKDGSIRFGIEAPRHVQVHREEVYRRIIGKHKRGH